MLQWKIGEFLKIKPVGHLFMVTDVGTRVLAAIRVQPAVVTDFVTVAEGIHRELSITEVQEEGWLNGPPYSLAEIVLDEADLIDCQRVEPEDIPGLKRGNRR